MGKVFVFFAVHSLIQLSKEEGYFKVANKVQFVEKSVALLWKENCLVLLVFASVDHCTAKLEMLVRDQVKTRLPSHYEPRKITVLRNQILPTTNHGLLIPKIIPQYLSKYL
jgi:hypothetical protein